MLINGIDLSSLGATLYNRVLTSNEVETSRDWLEGDIQPTFIRQQDKFKSMKLQFLITEKDEKSAFLIMSDLTMRLRKATLLFDDIDLLFDVTMKGKASQKRLANGNFILTVQLLSDYAKGESEIYTTDSRATDYFQLGLAYYKNGNISIANENVLIKASDFNGFNDTFESLGINLNKYQPDYYNQGQITNFPVQELTYENLLKTQVLIINYVPTIYSKNVEYFVQKDNVYSSLSQAIVTFTKVQVDKAVTLGQLIDFNSNKPIGYSAKSNFDLPLTFDNLMAFEPLQIYYDKIEQERSKDIIISFEEEQDNGVYQKVHEQIINVREGNIVDGSTLSDIFNVNSFQPEKYYDQGICQSHEMSELISFDSIESTYTVQYKLTENTIFVEYYLGEYPDWHRTNVNNYKIKYKKSFDESVDLIKDLGIDLDKYSMPTYEAGKLYNSNSLTSFDAILNAGVLQVYYIPKKYPITVNYFQDDVKTGTALGSKEVILTDLMFLNNPTLGELIDINAFRPEGYIYNELDSYHGELTLSALTYASPINIVYKEVETLRTKSIVVKYKKELASAFSIVNTSVITIEESAVGGGIRLDKLFDINAYKPEYYNNGIIDGYSDNAIVTFDEIQGTYDVLYMATEYSTQVRYYTDVVDNQNWLGSNSIKYRVIDFTTSTTLIDLGLNINAFKPVYCADGEVQYTGPVNFSSLVNLDAIDIVYLSVKEPDDPEGIKYPHRILFLQHNDMGNYEDSFPNWTLNHAYINTGVTVPDMSKLSVVCETVRVFEDQPLHAVNVDDAYLFGSVTPQGSYYIKFVNNTSYKQESLLTGKNTFNAVAGLGTPELIQDEVSAVGFSRNTGITASTRNGYSYATLTYTNLLQSNSAKMTVPLYLFACDYNGYYRGGIAGVGIAGCKIYYDNELIRDFVPVQFFDKIGTQTAPSNCLYDKVTQTFFEDARGLNSFNIMDDPEYQDVEPEHQIGCCQVNYFKDDQMFNSATIWFRASDFIDTKWDPYEKFFVDYYQPQYYGSGVIEDIEKFDITFNNLKNQTFNVRYKAEGYRVVVNYWKDSKDNTGNQLGTEIIELKEDDFKQAPTFGDIIPLMKYKPNSYKPTYNYPETKVTLNRILRHAPYDIIYTAVENPKIYTTTVKYYRRVFGIDLLNPLNMYSLEGTQTISLDETQFAEGVYPEQFIDMNAFKPNNDYYLKGVPFEWYEKDEMLTSPDKLKSEYIITYEPVPKYIDVNYYTDVEDELNLIASASWEIKINDWKDGEQFQLVDELPNTYLNKYKPVICGSGQIQDENVFFTFESLVNKGYISIIYPTLQEPHDPESTAFPNKVLWFVGDHGSKKSVPLSRAWTKLLTESSNDDYFGPYIPYLDLGYKPKEIGRLRIETKAYSLNQGAVTNKVNQFGIQSDSYSYFLGYYGALDPIVVRENIGTSDQCEKTILALTNHLNLPSEYYSKYSPNSTGWMAFKGHTCQVSSFVYTSPAPQDFDGHSGWNLEKNGYNIDYNKESVKEMFGGYRRGQYSTLDDNLNPIYLCHDYGIKIKKFDQELTPNGSKEWFGTSPELKPGLFSQSGVAFNPTTMVIDAYNNYMEEYDYTNSKHPYYINLENKDTDLFVSRCKPKGTISLFLTTNPDTGKININPFYNSTFCDFHNLWGGHDLESIVANQNPWSDTFEPTITVTQQVITGTMDDGTPIYETKTTKRNIAFVDYQLSVFPVPHRSLIWYIKIWDRDRLIRNLIPVAKDDEIYDFIAPANGLFDLVTETFYTNQNNGGKYTMVDKDNYIHELEVKPEEVFPLRVNNDPTVYGNIVVNYYNENNEFLANQFVEIPVHYDKNNISIEDILKYNDYKPSEFYHDGMIDVDLDIKNPNDETLKAIFDKGSINIYYKLITFTKTVVYYRSNSRVGSKDLFYSIQDLKNAKTLKDLGIDTELYASPDYKPGRIVFDESIIANDDIQTFIDASSPIVIYDKKDAIDAPNNLYLEYYRGGAYDDNLITLDPLNPNYLNCNLEAVVLNPKGAIKYINHYHDALYEDEQQSYFLAYQVQVLANYVTVHKGPARRYATLATIVDKGIYTVVEERNGWGRLKEYPKGWIMLSYTKAMSGPGQNPDYETPSIANVTIPFGERLTISKMTIDRLWVYSPQYASWIKAEEVSFDQSGKLYNAIGTEVIHLDEIDWSKAQTLEDIGIYPNKFVLKYHDDINYEISGPLTQEKLANIHNIEFVYPETIYTCNCNYYKGLKGPEYLLGKGSISYSLSDWNPDWDTFLETSYQIEEMDKYPIGINKTSSNIKILEKPSSNAQIVTEIPIGYTVEIIGESTVENQIWCKVINKRLNGNETGYVEKDRLTITPAKPWVRKINPTLYRDTPLTLTWDYFNINKNLYKPKTGNYNDGIYLWNPRSYNNDNVYFTFEELVTTAVQDILYLNTIQEFKMVGDFVTQQASNVLAQYHLDKLPFNFAPGVKINEDPATAGIHDIEIKHSGYPSSKYNDYLIYEKNIFKPKELRFIVTTGKKDSDHYGGHMKYSSIAPYDVNWKNNEYQIINISDKRNNTIVYTEGKDTTRYQAPFKTISYNGGYGKPVKDVAGVEITRKTNTTLPNFDLLAQFKHISAQITDYNKWWEAIRPYAEKTLDTQFYYWKDFEGKEVKSHPFYRNNNGAWTQGNYNHLEKISEYTKLLPWGTVDHPYFYTKTWTNYYLDHYIVPIARGQWLEDGRQVPYNTLYDIMTNTYIELPKELRNLKIYEVGKVITDENIYDPFNNWFFNTVDCQMTVKLNKNTTIYKAPDILSTPLGKHDIGTVIPVRKKTDDALNHVQGLWYSDGYGWFLATDADTLPLDQYLIKDLPAPIKIAIKGDKANTSVTYKTYVSPELNKQSTLSTFTSEKLEMFRFKCGDAYWNTVCGWVPIAYTEDGFTSINKAYVVSADYLDYYSHPIANDLYRIGQLQSGTRITAEKQLIKDPDWKYIQHHGWAIANELSVAEII